MDRGGVHGKGRSREEGAGVGGTRCTLAYWRSLRLLAPDKCAGAVTVSGKVMPGQASTSLEASSM